MKYFPSSKDWSKSLLDEVDELVPGLTLQWQTVPGTGLWGFFLEESWAARPLEPAVVEKVMDNPPFWSLLWPSGYKLCQTLTHDLGLMRNRSCVDLGSGSGLVSVALAKSAKSVLAVDSDPLSRRATRLNLMSNEIAAVAVEEKWCGDKTDTLILADFLYDEANLGLLDAFAGRAEEILVIDCKLEHLDYGCFSYCGRGSGVAVPNLDPHGEFGTLRVWYSGPRAAQWTSALAPLLIADK